MTQSFKIGIGYDIHRLVEGRPLILGGIEIPHDKGLSGHSDADAVSHAICDALLGAAALGDIGTHFPDTDPRFSGASSLVLLQEVIKKVNDAGYAVCNVDVIIMAERPKLAPYILEMRQHLSAILGIGIESVSIKAKTNEGLDSVGKREAIASQAIALIAATSEPQS